MPQEVILLMFKMIILSIIEILGQKIFFSTWNNDIQHALHI